MNPLLSIPGCSPSDLQDLGLLPLVYFPRPTLTPDQSANSLPALEHGVPPSGGQVPETQTLTPDAANADDLVNRTSPIANPETLTPDAPYSSASSACRAKAQRRRVPSVLKSARPRSKIGRLPIAIQTNLNTMLARGCRYRDIIHNLNTHGYSGFNKVNLNAWKKTGFQQWLRAAGSSETVQPVLEGDQKPVVTDNNR